jgi:hypothetical protein
MVHNAVGGDTGSGLGSWMMERLSVNYGKETKLSYPDWACPQIAMADFQPYTMVLRVHTLLEHIDVTIAYDCEALYGICRRNLDIASAAKLQLEPPDKNVLPGRCTAGGIAAVPGGAGGRGGHLRPGVPYGQRSG